jgi:hypothetical protein
MALVSSGKVSLGDISQEFGYPLSTPITLKLQNNGANKQVYINNNWVNLNPCSTFQPNVIAPHSITEWYRYDHNELCPTTTTTTTVSPCIAITDFSYTINGIVDGNSFTLNGVQDIDISFNSYSPDGYGTPLEYEYILDTSSSGIISNSTKNFSNLNIGGHTLIIKVYNCNRTNSVTKTIQFDIVAVTTTTTTTTSPVCVPVTNFNFKINGFDAVDGFTIGGGVQDFTISFSSYSPVGYSNPLEYKYTLDDSITDGIVSTDTKTFVGVNIGTHKIVIEVYSCNRVNVVTKTINFTVVDSPPTTTTTTTNPTCVPVTDFTLVIPNSTYPSMMEIRANNPNGTSPWVYSFTIVTPSRTLPSFTSQPIDGGAGAFFPVTCDDIGQWNISITATNCSGVGSVTKTGVSYLLPPILPRPTLSSCKYFDETFKASLQATDYNTASTLEVYEVNPFNTSEVTYLGNMVDGQFTVFIYGSDLTSYYVVSKLCNRVSQESYRTFVDFNMADC